MKEYNIKLLLPSPWKYTTSNEIDDNGDEMLHIEAVNAPEEVDIFVGEMPLDTTPEDQAFANYAEMVGFDDDEEPLDKDSVDNPICKIKFNGKNAWGFKAICEDGAVMELLAQEPKAGTLVVYSLKSPKNDSLNQLHTLLERSFRI